MPTTYDPVKTPEPSNNGQKGSIFKFPYTQDADRVSSYDFYEKLFFGRHYEAFNIRIQDEQFNKAYAKLRYVMANFAGLTSKVMADLLMGEAPKFKVEDGDQKFLNALLYENKFRIQCYESALQNSYLGDAVFKIRLDKRLSSDKNPTVIIEDVTPKIYFPEVNPFNVRAEPERKELAWICTINGERYLRKEIHMVGKIINEVYKMKDNEIMNKESLGILGIDGLEEEVDTGINRSLLIHIPNWKVGARHFGISDYYDLESLFFAINNRITKIDNVLDKHTDPILAIPEGILDEKGSVKRSKLNLFERPEGGNKENDPAYITWDANLESGFKQIDKLIEVLFMTSETSPDILGMGQGQAESGRALKLKLLRTLAKANRKQIYYHHGLIEVLYVAQLMAKEHGAEIDGVKLNGNPVKPEIEWNDGLPTDMVEAIENEVKRVDAGLSTKVDSLMRLDGIEQDMAEKKAKEIDKEGALDPIKANPLAPKMPPKEGNPNMK